MALLILRIQDLMAKAVAMLEGIPLNIMGDGTETVIPTVLMADFLALSQTTITGMDFSWTAQNMGLSTNGTQDCQSKFLGMRGAVA